MSDYSKTTNFTAKDALPSGDVNKRINGALFDEEFDPISTAVATKIDKVAGKTGFIPKFTASGGLESSGIVPEGAFPSGTVLAFFQAAAPIDWTQDTTNNDAMLRVVSGAGGGIGGSDSPISLSHTHTVASHSHTTGSLTLTIAQMPAHTHDVEDTAGSVGSIIGLARAGLGTSHGIVTDAALTKGGGGSHNHGDTGSKSLTTDSTAITPKYIDMIICTKD